MGSSEEISLGSWTMVAFLCLSLCSSLNALPAHTKRPTTEESTPNLSLCLDISTHLMKEAHKSLHHFQERFNCTMEQILLDNPNHEEKIIIACMGDRSSQPGSCPLGENDATDKVSCMNAIYTTLKQYEMKIKQFASPELLSAVNLMMQALNINHNITEQLPSIIRHPLERSYTQEMNQCKIFLILQQLTQTVHRNLRHRQSLEM